MDSKTKMKTIIAVTFMICITISIYAMSQRYYVEMSSRGCVKIDRFTGRIWSVKYDGCREIKNK